jgi:hypothetical protein
MHESIALLPKFGGQVMVVGAAWQAMGGEQNRNSFECGGTLWIRTKSVGVVRVVFGRMLGVCNRQW